jgi:hypothetical protein
VHRVVIEQADRVEVPGLVSSLWMDVIVELASGGQVEDAVRIGIDRPRLHGPTLLCQLSITDVLVRPISRRSRTSFPVASANHAARDREGATSPLETRRDVIG